MNKEQGDMLSDLNVLYTITELSTAIVLGLLCDNMVVYITRIDDDTVITDECLILEVVDTVKDVTNPEFRVQMLTLKFPNEDKPVKVMASYFFNKFAVLSLEPEAAQVVHERLVQHFGYKSDPYELCVHEIEEEIDMDAVMEDEFSHRLVSD